MSGSAQNSASQQALDTNKQLATGYYNIALPALDSRMGSINGALGRGETPQLQQAYAGQRAGLTEGLAAQGGVQQAQLMAGSKKAMSGGNSFASMHPADIGAQLANALYGSKFQEGQGNLDQQFNLMNMALGGAGTSGSGALEASRQQLGAIGYLPRYNQTYANVAGGLAGAGSVYGALNSAYPQLFGAPGTTNTGATLPTSTNYSGFGG